MHESDTYLAILEEGEAMGARKVILWVGEEQFGPVEQTVKDQLSQITDLERLKRMLRPTLKAASWQAILETP